VLRRLRRTLFTAVHRVRLALRKLRGPGDPGVHAVALTPSGNVVLVLLTYAPGWRIPGGGRKRGEPPLEAMLRELREEIGLVSHGAALALDPESTLFRVDDVEYRPRSSLEVEAVREFAPDSLPDDAAPWTRARIELALRA
jgi:8-oxo-dGTP pyrophosphatase MutT (NUDIX family)